jgi:hypothetical protein
MQLQGFTDNPGQGNCPGIENGHRAEEKGASYRVRFRQSGEESQELR